MSGLDEDVRCDVTRARGLTPPSQQRSRATLDRILCATERLLDGRSFGDISVLEICNAAEVSPSSFYARFDSKDRLLVVLHQRHLEVRKQFLDGVADGLDLRTFTIREVLELAAGAYLQIHTDESRLIQTLRRAEIDSPALADARRVLDRYGMDLVANGLLQMVPEADDDLRRRISFATRSACAAIQEAVQPPFVFAGDLTLDEATTIREVVEMWLRYVFGTGDPAGAIQQEEETT